MSNPKQEVVLTDALANAIRDGGIFSGHAHLFKKFGEEIAASTGMGVKVESYFVKEGIAASVSIVDHSKRINEKLCNLVPRGGMEGYTVKPISTRFKIYTHLK